MAGGTLFHLVRHASYDLTGRALGGRVPGHSLTAAGREEAGALAAGMAGRPVARLVTSPVQRARETAQILAAALGRAAEVEDEFDEIDFGRWNGMPFEALDGDPAWQAWNRFRGHARPPGGESMPAAQARALACVARLHAAHPGGEIVAVTHGDIIKAVLAHFLGTPLDMLRRLDVAPASRSVLVLYDQDARVEALNLPPGA